MWQLPVAIGLSPNTDFQDFLQALKSLIALNRWQSGESGDKVKKWFKDYLKTSYITTYNSARSGLFAILKCLELEKGSEVLVQAFTCVAVPNSVLWAGLKPIYVDVDSSMNIDVYDCEKKITPKTRAIIVQHTFGTPADMDKVLEFVERNNLILIEDCAHSLGSTYNGQKIGTFGRASVFSFGRDKVISSVFGGLVATTDPLLGEKIKRFEQGLPGPSRAWIFQQLLHPIILSLVLPLYKIGIGKLILWISQKLNLLSFPVYKEELTGKQPAIFPGKYPNALAQLLLIQLSKFDKMIEKRQKNALQYYQKITTHIPFRRKGSVYLRFNILTNQRDSILFFAKKRGMILGNWYHHIVDPGQTGLKILGYREGSCPKAEKYARLSLNLPTYPRLAQNQIINICDFVNYYEKSVKD